MSKETKRAGRPPKPKAEIFSRRLQVVMTESEYKQLQDEARKEGSTVASFVRSRILLQLNESANANRR